jgi:aryl-alcohol dehydrogenase-like predicted oxidoreductase
MCCFVGRVGRSTSSVFTACIPRKICRCVARRRVVTSVAIDGLINATPAVVPLCGVSSEAQLAANLAAAEIRISAEQLARLNAA